MESQYAFVEPATGALSGTRLRGAPGPRARAEGAQSWRCAGGPHPPAPRPARRRGAGGLGRWAVCKDPAVPRTGSAAAAPRAPPPHHCFLGRTRGSRGSSGLHIPRPLSFQVLLSLWSAHADPQIATSVPPAPQVCFCSCADTSCSPTCVPSSPQAQALLPVSHVPAATAQRLRGPVGGEGSRGGAPGHSPTQSFRFQCSRLPGGQTHS